MMRFLMNGFSRKFLILEINTAGDEGEDEFDKSKILQDQLLEDMIPKMNKEATKLHEVYCITDLIEPAILEKLETDAVKVLKTNSEDIPLVLHRFELFFEIPQLASLSLSFHRLKCKFLVELVQAVQRSKIPDSPENMLKVKACIYIDALIAYLQQVNKVRSQQKVHLNAISNATSELDAHLRKKFAQPHTKFT